jgi:hypothetical protein
MIVDLPAPFLAGDGADLTALERKAHIIVGDDAVRVGLADVFQTDDFFHALILL